MLNRLKIKIFGDGTLLRDGVRGYTTNPSLMRKAGVENYEAWAKAFTTMTTLPISFEVTAHDAREIYDQAKKIASWGENVYVKIPIVNPEGRSLLPLINSLSSGGIKVNVTAVMTISQVEQAAEALADGPAAYISIFAGRIADTGYDPAIIVKHAVWHVAEYPNIELIWASTREVLNIFQANDLGCHIITVTSDILKKLSLVGKNLTEYSRETSEQFYKDAQAAGYTL